MKQEFYSIKGMAVELGVSKQRVYRCIKKHCIKESHSEVVNGNTVLMYDNLAFIKVSDILKSNETASEEVHQETHEAHQETVEKHYVDALVKQLEEQLSFFREQMTIKDEQISELQKLLDQSQKLNAMDKQKILELEDKMQADQEQTENKKWWQKLFS